MRVFVDANVFLRYFVLDDQRQVAKAETLFRDASEGKVELVCGPPVLFELAWTLRRPFGQTRLQVLEAIQCVLALPGLKLLDAPLVRRAVEIGLAHGMEFADAYIAASALGSRASVATFNERDFKDTGVVLRPWSAV